MKLKVNSILRNVFCNEIDACRIINRNFNSSHFTENVYIPKIQTIYYFNLMHYFIYICLTILQKSQLKSPHLPTT